MFKLRLIMLFLGFSIIMPSLSMAQETQSVINKTSDGISTVYNDVKSTAPKIQEALSTLGKELKVGANAVWDVLVKQQRVWSYCFLILTLSAMFNWYLFYKRNFGKLSEDDYILGEQNTFDKVPNPYYDENYHRRYKDYEDKPNYANEISDARYAKYINVAEGKKTIIVPLTQDKIVGFRYLHLTICLCLSALSIYHFAAMLTGFINPEYGAMKTIAEIATQIK